MSFCCEWLLPVCVCSRETLHQAYDGTISRVPVPVPVRGRWKPEKPGPGPGPFCDSSSPSPPCPSTFSTTVPRMAECLRAAACGSRVLGILASEGCALLLHLCCQCGLWDVLLLRSPASGHSKIQGVDAGQGHHGRDAVSSCVTPEAHLVSILFTC